MTPEIGAQSVDPWSPPHYDQLQLCHHHHHHHRQPALPFPLPPPQTRRVGAVRTPRYVLCSLNDPRDWRSKRRSLVSSALRPAPALPPPPPPPSAGSPFPSPTTTDATRGRCTHPTLRLQLAVSSTSMTSPSFATTSPSSATTTTTISRPPLSQHYRRTPCYVLSSLSDPQDSAHSSLPPPQAQRMLTGTYVARRADHRVALSPALSGW
jgi:hypothetical protein